ncbi:MAG: dual specificity protein phosphatase family protein [Desulfurococcales archaeon]|nr:dual specificity protein phosphatase family protein [Desulfurococcales archaeon]
MCYGGHAYSLIEEGLYAGEGCIEPPQVDAVICLASDCRVKVNGVAEFCFEVEDFGVEPINNFANALRKLLELRARGLRVYVHCYAGCGRSGTLVAAYLILARGLSAEEAIAYYRLRRGCGPQSWEQRELLYALDMLSRKVGRERAIEYLLESRDFGDFLARARKAMVG